MLQFLTIILLIASNNIKEIICLVINMAFTQEIMQMYLKHICLIYFIKSIKKSNNSIIYIDTHSGGGIYNFNHDYMKKNKEYLSGIAK